MDVAPSGNLSTEGIPKSISRILDAAKIREDFKQRKRTALDEPSDGSGRPKKKRKQAVEDTKEKATTASNEKGKEKAAEIKIKPGETLAHFNRCVVVFSLFTMPGNRIEQYILIVWGYRRVEDDMRPLVRTAIQKSSARERQERKSTGKTKTAGNSSESSSQAKTSKGGKSSSRDDEASDTPTQPLDKHASKAKEFKAISTSAPRRLNDIAMAPPDLKRLPRGVKKDGTKGKGDGLGKAGILSMAQRAMMEVEREKAIVRYRELKERRAKEGRSTGALVPEDS